MYSTKMLSAISRLSIKNEFGNAKFCHQFLTPTSCDRFVCKGNNYRTFNSLKHVNLSIDKPDIIGTYQPFRQQVKHSQCCNYSTNENDKKLGNPECDNLDDATLTVTKESHTKSDKDKLFKFDPKKMIQYTCKVCSTRNSATFSTKAYEKGVVIVTCEGCDNKHLIADNLGWFKSKDEQWNIEKNLKERGENIQYETSDNILEVVPDDSK